MRRDFALDARYARRSQTPASSWPLRCPAGAHGGFRSGRRWDVIRHGHRGTPPAGVGERTGRRCPGDATRTGLCCIGVDLLTSDAIPASIVACSRTTLRSPIYGTSGIRMNDVLTQCRPASRPLIVMLLIAVAGCSIIVNLWFLPSGLWKPVLLHTGGWVHPRFPSGCGSCRG